VGRHHEQVAWVLLGEVEHGARRVERGNVGLGHAQAELALDVGGFGIGGEQAPAGERAAHSGEGRPVRVVVVLELLRMDQIEVAPGPDREPQGVREGRFAAVGEVRRMDDVVEFQRAGRRGRGHEASTSMVDGSVVAGHGPAPCAAAGT
jgi:hypothetical protein